MSRILAIDQSTSATKAAAFDDAGRLMFRASREHRQIYPRPGWVEHDANEIWRNTLAVIEDLLRQQPSISKEWAAISISNQRETIVVFDRKTGEPLHNAIVWQDRRGDGICRRILEQGGEKLVRGRTGLRIDTYFSASKLQWLIEEVPGVRAKLLSGDAVVGTIDAYLVHRLTHGRVFATDATNASRTLLFDIDRLCWDPDLCALFGVPLEALPEVREPFASFGHTGAEGLLPSEVEIHGVMGDSQASLFAQRCFQPGSAKATFGTGTSVLLNIGSSRGSEKNGGAVTALAWVLNGSPVYALEGLINYSAATLSWLKDQLGLIASANEAEALAAAVPDNGGVYLVPAFAGLGAPYWSSDARAAIVGLTGHSRREHIVRAALESIAYQLRDVLDMMREDSGVTPRLLEADGGPTRNKLLMQFCADITQAELLASDTPESSALGAAMAAMLGLGIKPTLADIARLPRDGQTFKPSLPPEHAQRLQNQWRAAVKRVL